MKRIFVLFLMFMVFCGFDSTKPDPNNYNVKTCLDHTRANFEDLETLLATIGLHWDARTSTYVAGIDPNNPTNYFLIGPMAVFSTLPSNLSNAVEGEFFFDGVNHRFYIVQDSNGTKSLKDIGSNLKTVATPNDLPATGSTGDVIIVRSNNNIYTWDDVEKKWVNMLVEVVAETDYHVKVGPSGTPDYLNQDYFEQDSSNHIRPKHRVNDGGTAPTDLWSGSYLSGIYNPTKQTFSGANLYGKVSNVGNKSGTYTLLLDSAGVIKINLVGNIFLSATNYPTSGYAIGVVVLITSSGSYTITYDTNWKWSGAKIESISSGETIALSLLVHGTDASSVIASCSYLY